MKQCEPRDIPRMLEFYQLVIRETEEMSQHARWEYGKHPTKEMIGNYVKQRMMYYLDKEKEIAASVVVTPFQTSEYHTPCWNERTNAFYKKSGYRIIKVEDGFTFYQKRKSEPNTIRDFT